MSLALVRRTRNGGRRLGIIVVIVVSEGGPGGFVTDRYARGFTETFTEFRAYSTLLPYPYTSPISLREQETDKLREIS